TTRKASSTPFLQTEQEQPLNQVEKLTLCLERLTNDTNELQQCLACYTDNRLNSDLEGLKMEHEKEMSDMNKFLEEISEALHKCKEPNENTNSYRTLHSRLLSEWSQSMEKVSRLRESNRKLKEEQTMLQESCENTKRLREEVHEMIYALWTKQKQEHQVLEDSIQLLQKQKALLIQQRDLAVKEQHPFTVSQMRFENCQQELEQITAQDDSLLQMELLEQKHHVPENTNQIHKDPDIHQQMAPVRGKITSEEDMWTRKSGYCKIKQPREKERENGDSSNIENEESANQDIQNRLLNLESANLMQELQSINNKCIAKIGFVDNKYEYLMDRTLTLQSEVVTTQTLCKEERSSLTDKIRSLESCVSEEHNRWYDSMKNLESLVREEVHSLEQTLCAHLQALEETLCKHDKEPNKQKGKTIKVVTSPNGSNPMAYPVIVHERPADDTHPEPYVTHTLQPISIRDFKNMKEAIVTYGIHSTYVKQMLNSWSTSNRIIPDDWHQLTSAVLEYSQQLQWKSWLREEARNLEQQGGFGLATTVEYEEEEMKTLGSIHNLIAPAVLSVGSFEEDVWSIGCIMYTMLVGKPPYETYFQIRKNEHSIPKICAWIMTMYDHVTFLGVEKALPDCPWEKEEPVVWETNEAIECHLSDMVQQLTRINASKSSERRLVQQEEAENPACIPIFWDHTKLILCPMMASVTYINKNGDFCTYCLSLMEEYGCCKELGGKLGYAHTMVDRLLRSKSTGNRLKDF
ncbi:hypothetical protein STEG23_009602, partial [Scotinomys teguina]